MNILVIQVSRIGDTLLVTPAIRALHDLYPESKITVAAYPGRNRVLENLPFIDSLISLTGPRAKLLNLLPTQERYELAFVYGFSPDFVWYAIHRSSRVIAHTQSDDAVNAKLFKEVSPPPFQAEHAIFMNIRLLEAIGFDRSALNPRIAYRVTNGERIWAERFLRGRIPKVRFLIGVQTTSFPTKAYRDWPPEHFVELLRGLREEFPESFFVFFGGATEKRKNADIAKRVGEDCCLNVTGKVGLRETGAIMEKLNFYIGVDTGPTHLMSAFDIPMVVLYHPYSSSRLIGAIGHPAFFPIDPEPDRKLLEPTDYSMQDLPVSEVLAQTRRVIKSL